MPILTLNHAEPTELLSMAVTLCTYEDLLGPYHPQTLSLMVSVAEAYGQHGEIGHARSLLERALADIGGALSHGHPLRLRALAVLRDLWVQEREDEKACAVQKQLLECQVNSLGADHPDSVATRADLAIMFLKVADRIAKEV